VHLRRQVAGLMESENAEAVAAAALGVCEVVNETEVTSLAEHALALPERAYGVVIQP